MTGKGAVLLLSLIHIFLSFFKTIHTIQMGIIEILNPVNGFRDDWSIDDVFERVKKEVFDNAVAVGRAWEEMCIRDRSCSVIPGSTAYNCFKPTAMSGFDFSSSLTYIRPF